MAENDENTLFRRSAQNRIASADDLDEAICQMGTMLASMVPKRHTLAASGCETGTVRGSNDQPDMQSEPTATLRPTRLKTRFYSDATLKLLADVLGDADGKA